ncbi:MAG TPA: hypothetical protein VNO70_14390 [Blastocatellia bacterium]|nr:hypothetical protein [Blastocatellia bacterium]
MEKDREISRLINVLHRIARAAHYVAWNRMGADAARFCAAQYNRVLARLSELEPDISRLFTPLPEDAAPEVTRIAARELAAYFEEEEGYAHGRHYAGCCGPWRVWFGWSPMSGWR